MDDSVDESPQHEGEADFWQGAGECQHVLADQQPQQPHQAGVKHVEVPAAMLQQEELGRPVEELLLVTDVTAMSRCGSRC